MTDLRRLTQSVGDLAEVHSFEEMQKSVFASMENLAPASLVTNDQVDLEKKVYSQVTNHVIPGSSKLIPRFGELLLQGHHPYVEYIRKGGKEIAVRTTDLISEKKLRRNLIYNDVYRPGGVPYGMFAMVRINGPIPFLSFAILRDKNFTDTEQALARVYLEQVGRAVFRLLRQTSQLERVFLNNCGSYGLTSRETEIMLLLFKGKTDKEIASSLGNAPRTVSNQVASIFRKVGVHSRSEAVRKLLEGLHV